MGHPRSLKMAPFDRPYNSLVVASVTIALSCISSETKRDICRKLWFFHTPLHSTPPA